jgi:hypothetical protein
MQEMIRQQDDKRESQPRQLEPFAFFPYSSFYSDTPQMPRPPQTPSHSRGDPLWLGPPCGDQLMLDTS